MSACIGPETTATEVVVGSYGGLRVRMVKGRLSNLWKMVGCSDPDAVWKVCLVNIALLVFYKHLVSNVSSNGWTTIMSESEPM